MSETLSTPAAVVEPEIVHRNIERMAGYAAEKGIGLRPHTKTHKSSWVAAKQVRAGAVGLTVATVREAEVMAPVTDDLLVAYPSVEPRRCERIAGLAAERTVRVALDGDAAADAIGSAAARVGSTVGILVDVDVGLGRTGVQRADEVRRLAGRVAETPALRLDGVMFYPGHIWSLPQQQADELRAVDRVVGEALAAWHAADAAEPIVSGGSTPTAFQSHHVSRATEVRPGTYVYNDMNCVRGGFASVEDCAVRVLTTVVSDAVPGQVVVDAGSKALTGEGCRTAADSGHGHVVELPGAKVDHLSEEHGQVDVRRCERRPAVGERVTIVPNHVCPCVNLHDRLWWRTDEGPRPLPVEARSGTS